MKKFIKKTISGQKGMKINILEGFSSNLESAF